MGCALSALLLSTEPRIHQSFAGLLTTPLPIASAKTLIPVPSFDCESSRPSRHDPKKDLKDDGTNPNMKVPVLSAISADVDCT